MRRTAQGGVCVFGYVLPCKPELKMREWQEYRAAYCGLCKELKREYGFLSRLFLNYDFVLLSLIADSLAGVHGNCCAQRCIANPVEKRPVSESTKGLSLAADALVLTVYYKLADDLSDEPLLKKLPALVMRPLVGRCRKKAAVRHPELDAVLARQTEAQSDLERVSTQSTDAAAEPTAQMTAALFAAAAQDEGTRRPLFRLGLFVGKILYYLDAADDYEKDKADGAYNVFLLSGLSKEQAVEEAKRLCRMCAGEASLCYHLLALQTHKELLDNILFLGIPQSIEAAGKPRKREKERV